MYKKKKLYLKSLLRCNSNISRRYCRYDIDISYELITNNIEIYIHYKKKTPIQLSQIILNILFYIYSPID